MKGKRAFPAGNFKIRSGEVSGTRDLKPEAPRKNGFVLSCHQCGNFTRKREGSISSPGQNEDR